MRLQSSRLLYQFVAGDLDSHALEVVVKVFSTISKLFFLRGVADKIFPRGSPACRHRSRERQLFARSQAPQARKRHKLAHLRRFTVPQAASARPRGRVRRIPHAGLGVVALHLREHRKRGAAVVSSPLIYMANGVYACATATALGHIVGGRRDGGVAHDRVQDLACCGRGAETSACFSPVCSPPAPK